MAHAFSLSTQEVEAGDLCEFEASLVYRVSSRTAKAIQRLCLKQTPQKTNKQANKQTNKTHRQQQQKLKEEINMVSKLVKIY